MNRLSWNEYALKLAEVAALRSEDPYVQVGACILDKDNRVLSLGYNGLAPGTNVDPTFWEDRDGRRPYMLHAEVNALSLVKRNEGAAILACNLLPCTSCAQMIAAYGIKTVVYKEEYTRDDQAKKIFTFYGIDLISLQ